MHFIFHSLSSLYYVVYLHSRTIYLLQSHHIVYFLKLMYYFTLLNSLLIENILPHVLIYLCQLNMLHIIKLLNYRWYANRCINDVCNMNLNII